MSIVLDYSNVITPTEILRNSSVVIGDNGRIEYVGPMDLKPEISGQRLELRNLYVAPGLIDIHVHGGNGITFGNPESLAKDLQEYSKWVVRNGVTGFLTTITAPTPNELSAMIQLFVKEFEQEFPGAQPLGIHLEGPFMNVENKGAQNPDWIRDPSVEEAVKYLEAGRGWIKQMTMAPELPNAVEVSKRYRKAGVTLAIGHTTADYEMAVKALKTYWTHITHTFNAQPGLHHRKPGVVGAIMNSEEITAELIMDLIHVHPGAAKTLFRCVGSDRIVLVTDAMEAAGLPDGIYHLLGAKVTVQNGKATQDDGTIAGSSAVLNQCVRNMHKEVGVSLSDAIKMATLNPARVIGENCKRGSIQVGNRADLIVVDQDINVYLTFVNGKLVFSDF